MEATIKLYGTAISDLKTNNALPSFKSSTIKIYKIKTEK